jgi:glycosyltransferase involved in cell wall biosynthesis
VKPRISVIIPCYNGGRYLADAVVSVQRQTLAAWELIVVDDGSCDETRAVAESIALTDRRIRVVSQSHRGQSSAMNTGLRAASPDAVSVLCLDSDDVLEPSALEEMAHHLSRHPEAGAVLCHQEWIDGDGRLVDGGRRRRWRKGWLLLRQLRDSDTQVPFLTFFCGNAAGPFTMWRRSSLDAAGSWDESLVFWNDADLLCRVALQSSIHFLPRVLYRYRRHQGQSTLRVAEVGQFYEAFRKKWLAWTPSNARERQLLIEAHHFYYRVFRPFREMHVARLSIGSFLRTRDSGQLSWGWTCVKSAIRKALQAAPQLDCQRRS